MLNKSNQKGAIHILVAMFAIGLIGAFIVRSSSFLKTRLFAEFSPNLSFATGSNWPNDQYASAGVVNDPQNLGTPYYYEWGEILGNPPDQPAPAPNHRILRMVGKLDRGDSLACNSCTQSNIDTIYNDETPRIQNLLSRDINKGGAWVVGNEVNWYPKIPASLHAYQYKKYYDLIKGLDGTAKLAHSGLLYIGYLPAMSTYGGPVEDPVIYLNAFLAGLPASYYPDIYNVHFYPSVNREENQYRAFTNNINQAQTFKNHIQSINPGKPIWVTEVGMNTQATVAQTNTYMDTMIGALKNQGYDRWFWFIGHSWFDGNGVEQFGYTALTRNGAVSEVGLHYKSLASLDSSPSATPTPTPTPSATPSATPIPTVAPTPTPVPPQQGNGINAQYFKDKVLSNPGIQRTDSQINFNWGTNSPAAGLPTDNFSVRWDGFIKTPVETGTYTFYTKSDDGIRVWINNTLLINRWVNQNVYKEYSGNITLNGNKSYPIKVEYFDNRGSAVVELRWSGPGLTKIIIPTANLYTSNPGSGSPTPTPTPTTTPTSQPAPADNNGLSADYFTNKTLSGTAALTRPDAQVYFNWGSGSPDSAIPDNNFSVRWTGSLQTPPGSAGTYTFHTNSDDGIRVWVNNQQVVNSWVDQNGNTERFGSISLEGGQTYPIKVEYYDGWGNSFAELRWSGPGIIKDLIPAANLSH